jgi:hypothetical protein
MFIIFKEENKPLTERAKVDELLTKVQNSSLSAAVAQLRYPERLMRQTELTVGGAVEEADKVAAVGPRMRNRSRERRTRRTWWREQDFILLTNGMGEIVIRRA